MSALMPKARVGSDRPLTDRPILVVDDDRKIVALVRAYLEREGYRVATAYDGRDAVEKARSERPALIVPGCTSRRGGISAPGRGANYSLPKPFSPAELVVRVKAILRRAGPGAA